MKNTEHLALLFVGGRDQSKILLPRVAPTLPFMSATVKKPEQAMDGTR
jgi:hypothetical protein